VNLQTDASETVQATVHAGNYRSSRSIRLTAKRENQPGAAREKLPAVLALATKFNEKCRS